MEVPFCSGLISLLEKESAVRVGRSCMNKRVDAPRIISSQDVVHAHFSGCFPGSGAFGPLNYLRRPSRSFLRVQICPPPTCRGEKAVIFIFFSCASRSRLAPESLDSGFLEREPGIESVLCRHEVSSALFQVLPKAACGVQAHVCAWVT